MFFRGARFPVRLAEMGAYILFCSELQAHFLHFCEFVSGQCHLFATEYRPHPWGVSIFVRNSATHAPRGVPIFSRAKWYFSRFPHNAGARLLPFF